MHELTPSVARLVSRRALSVITGLARLGLLALLGGLALPGCGSAPPATEPARDADRDGIADAADRCPADPEDHDGFEDTDGCPESDNDLDGIPDVNDMCPMTPEDMDGFEDHDGCGEQDNDRDGIADVDDQCPMQPETFNGIDDEDGCPDRSCGPMPFETRIEILDKLYFATGQATIDRRAEPLADAIAEVLRDNPALRLQVVGHTDDRGSPAANLAMGLRRARSVRDALVARGVAPERLEAISLGSADPLDTNATRAGRERNRRVGFRVLVDEKGAPR